MKKKIFKLLGVLAWLGSLWLVLDGEIEKTAGNAFYDAPAAVILSEHRGEYGGGSSMLEILDHRDVEYSAWSKLCGNTLLFSLEAGENAKLDFQGKVKKGEARLMLEHTKSKEIIEFVLEETQREILLPEGEYACFLTGKDFKGGFSFTSENVLIQEDAVHIEQQNTYRQISMDTAVTMIQEEKGYIILDVRTAEEFADGHIPEAVNIPNEEIGTEEIVELPDKEQLILVYCRSGNRSKQASQKLADLGYTNVVEFGGIRDWTGEIVK